MIFSTTPPTAAHHTASTAAADLSPCRWSDDDVALGCECANPTLQIERWGQEASAQPIQQFN
jgi:hypothetical protein